MPDEERGWSEGSRGEERVYCVAHTKARVSRRTQSAPGDSSSPFATLTGGAAAESVSFECRRFLFGGARVVVAAADDSSSDESVMVSIGLCVVATTEHRERVSRGLERVRRQLRAYCRRVQ